MHLHPIRLVDQSAAAPICQMCQRYCAIRAGQSGFCRAVINRGGTLYSTIYGLIAEYGIDPIEKKPVRGYRPGTHVLSIGTFGCNLRCSWCQNWEIAFVDAHNPILADRYTPGYVVDMALKAGCAGIAWTYNEPSIWVDFIADCAAAAHEAGLYTVLVTNGFFSPESRSLLQPLIDVYRVDLKNLDADIYQKHCHIDSNQAVLDGIVAMHHAGIHVELVTVVMPELITPGHLDRMAEWIVENLGSATPWHLTRYVPYAQLIDLRPTSREELQQAAAIAHSAGMSRVYVGDWYEAGS
ncbi:MAG: AmmeMemoRadiSam system radical SAM enzyme [Chloroflexales bacterium]